MKGGADLYEFLEFRGYVHKTQPINNAQHQSSGPTHPTLRETSFCSGCFFICPFKLKASQELPFPRTRMTKVGIRNPEGWFRCRYCRTAFKGVKILVDHKREMHLYPSTKGLKIPQQREEMNRGQGNPEKAGSRNNDRNSFIYLDETFRSVKVSTAKQEQKQRNVNHLPPNTRLNQDEQPDKKALPIQPHLAQVQLSSATPISQILSPVPPPPTQFFQTAYQTSDIKPDHLQDSRLNYVSPHLFSPFSQPGSEPVEIHMASFSYLANPARPPSSIKEEEQFPRNSHQSSSLPKTNQSRCQTGQLPSQKRIPPKLIKSEVALNHDETWTPVPVTPGPDRVAQHLEPYAIANLPCHSTPPGSSSSSNHLNSMYPPSKPEELIAISKAGPSKKHQCAFCGQHFKVSWARKRHEKKMHVLLKNFISTTAFASSAKKNPKEASSTQPINKAQYPIIRTPKFTCEACGKSYKFKSVLKQHQVYTICSWYFYQKIDSHNQYLRKCGEEEKEKIRNSLLI